MLIQPRCHYNQVYNLERLKTVSLERAAYNVGFLAKLSNRWSRRLVVRQAGSNKILTLGRHDRLVWKFDRVRVEHRIVSQDPVLRLAIPKRPFSK